MCAFEHPMHMHECVHVCAKCGCMHECVNTRVLQCVHACVLICDCVHADAWLCVQSAHTLREIYREPLAQLEVLGFMNSSDNLKVRVCACYCECSMCVYCTFLCVCILVCVRACVVACLCVCVLFLFACVRVGVRMFLSVRVLDVGVFASECFVRACFQRMLVCVVFCVRLCVRVCMRVCVYLSDWVCVYI